MQPILIVQHDRHDGPSYFATWLKKQGLDFEVVHLFDGAALPAAMDRYSGLCILGGPMSANDALAYYPPLFALVRQAVGRHQPVIGHCLGGQILSRALGGTVQASEQVEIGWSTLQPCHESATDWFGSEPLQLFQWHAESFSIPPGATRLLQGAHCANQAFVVDELHLGMQFHCEVDADKVRSWLSLGAAEMQQCAQSPGVQLAHTILATLDADIARSQRTADHIYSRWALGLTAGAVRA